MDAIDKLPPEQRERILDPVRRMIMTIGGQDIVIDQSDDYTQEELDYIEKLQRHALRDSMGRIGSDGGYYRRPTEEDLERTAAKRIAYEKHRISWKTKKKKILPMRKTVDTRIGLEAETKQRDSQKQSRGVLAVGEPPQESPLLWLMRVRP